MAVEIYMEGNNNFNGQVKQPNQIMVAGFYADFLFVILSFNWSLTMISKEHLLVINNKEVSNPNASRTSNCFTHSHNL
jgi:hypothetical protein